METKQCEPIVNENGSYMDPDYGKNKKDRVPRQPKENQHYRRVVDTNGVCRMYLMSDEHFRKKYNGVECDEPSSIRPSPRSMVRPASPRPVSPFSPMVRPASPRPVSPFGPMVRPASPRPVSPFGPMARPASPRPVSPFGPMARPASYVSPPPPQTCIPSAHAKPVEFIKATSVSPTDIWVFEDDKHTYFGKVYIMPTQHYKDSFGISYEAHVYDYVKKNIIDDVTNPYRNNFVELQKHCTNITFDELFAMVDSFRPLIKKSNVARNIAYIMCNIYNRPSLTDNRPSLTNNSKLLEIDPLQLSCFRSVSGSPDHYKYGIIFTKKPKGDMVVTLDDYMEDHTKRPIDKYNVLLKAVLCIETMHRNGISHNDQHWGNILVAIGADEENKVYTLDNMEHTFRGSKDRPILFDWDRAQIKGGILNKDIVPDIYGIYTPAHEPLRDWYLFFKQLFILYRWNPRRSTT